MTPNQLADASMREVREQSYTGMIIIDPQDLKQIMRSVAEKAYAEGHEHGVGMGRKIERTGQKTQDSGFRKPASVERALARFTRVRVPDSEL